MPVSIPTTHLRVKAQVRRADWSEGLRPVSDRSYKPVKLTITIGTTTVEAMVTINGHDEQALAFHREAEVMINLAINTIDSIHFLHNDKLSKGNRLAIWHGLDAIEPAMTLDDQEPTNSHSTSR